MRWQGLEPGELAMRDGTAEPCLQGWVERDGLRLRVRVLPGEGTPVLFLTGGPGLPPTQFLNYRPFLEGLREGAGPRPLILLDQRGSGESTPDLAMRGFEGEVDAEHLLAAWLGLAREESTRMRAEGVDLAAINPAASADDLPAVLDALGVEKAILWGYSYGTHLAIAAEKRHPERWERVVLCGFEGPDQTWKLPSRTQAQLEKLDALAPGLIASMERVHRQLAEEGGLFALQVVAASWLGMANRFVNLPALYRGLEAGDRSLLEKGLGYHLAAAKGNAAFFLCDLASGATATRLARIQAEAPGCLLGGAANFPFPDIREGWGQIDLGDAFRAEWRSEAEILVLTGSLDGFTPTENFLESRAGLPNAHGIEIEHADHNALLLCPQANIQVLRFLDSGSAPEQAHYRVAPPSFR